MEKIINLIQKAHKKINFIFLLTVGLSLTNVLFIAFILIIGYFNPIHIDDYCFLAKQKEFGFWGSLNWWYNHWQGRFMPHIFTNLFVYIYQIIGSTLPLTILHVATFAFASFRITKNLNHVFYNTIVFNKILVWNLIFLFFAQIFLVTFEQSTFFWVNVSTMYFGGLFFLLLGISELLSNSGKWYSYCLIILCFTYVGSSSEHVGLITSTFMILVSIISIYNNKLDFYKNPISKKLFLGTIICLSAFLIMFFAPGNQNRIANFPKISVLESIPIATKSFINLLSHIKEKSIYLLLLSCPFVMYGSFCRKKIKETSFLISILIATVLLVCFLFVMMIPTAYATSSSGPWRAQTYISGILCVFSISAAFAFGYYTSISKKISFFLAMLGVFFFFITTSKKYYLELMDTVEYAIAERNKIELLIEEKTHTKDIFILTRKKAGKRNLLWEYPLSPNPDNWYNKCVCEGLQLDFQVIEK